MLPLLWVTDHRLFLLLNGHPAAALARALAGLLLRVGTGGACWLALFLFVFLIGGRRGRRIALTGALAVLLAHAVAAWGLEGLVQRADPRLVLPPGVFTLAPFQPPFSFPATRVAAAFAALPFLNRGGTTATALVWAVAVGLAWAEVYGGAAFPTDALAGLLIGLACARLATWLLGDPFRRRPGPLIPLSRRGRGTPAAPLSPAQP